MTKKILAGSALVLALSVVVSASPALAWGGSDIEVENDSYANIRNDVQVGAYTGENVTAGGNGGNGGFTFSGNANGGNGGANSGSIHTGTAYAKAKVVNVANTNLTGITAWCSGCRGDIEVENDDSDATVGNGVAVFADTGLNGAVGGVAGNGGFGGSTNGGNGGLNSGGITTGSAYSKAKVVNVVNTNITRILRY